MKKLLILDIDETLVYATKNKLDINEDFKVYDYYVYIRPYLLNFLEIISNHYNIAIWSSASEDYVKEIVKNIVPKKINLIFLWGRKQCTLKHDFETHEFYYSKNLSKAKKLGYSLNEMLIVENTPRKVMGHYGNAIYVNDYVGNFNNDNELNLLLKYLINISSSKNFRNFEKRTWKKEIQSPPSS